MSMKRLFTLLLAAALVACGRTAPAPAASNESGTPNPESRKYLLERVDDAAVVQYYADGFNALPLREKTLIWHLYQAALAGRDIFIDQKHHSALEMRSVLDQIVAHPQGIDPATFAESSATRNTSGSTTGRITT
jgi:dipeptidyl-peptidase-3